MVAPSVKSTTAEQDKDYWATPTEIVSGALAYFKSKGLLSSNAVYGLDVCASKHNTKHTNFISEQEDSLSQSWAERLPSNGVAWCNPPYSRGMKEQFISKAHSEVVPTIMLLPNDTSAQWFSECVKKAVAIAFVCNGRIGFINNSTGERVNNNNSGSILVLFGNKAQGIAKTMYVTKSKLETLGDTNE